MNQPDSIPLPISRFDYELPPELIAQRPAEPRDASRLLVVDRGTGSLVDRTFSELPNILRPGDLLVMNDSRVIPARFYARRASGSRIEFLLLEEYSQDEWSALARGARRLRTGDTLHVLDHNEDASERTIQYLGRGEGGTVLIRFERALHDLQHLGHLPLPHYIHKELDSPDRYQTIYAQHLGSAAAPTAGLHFTREMLDRCRARGIDTATITLHVGLGTFQLVKVDDAREHQIHAESFHVPAETANALLRARSEGRRIVAVGSTSVRTLESIAPDIRMDTAISGSTRVYITPPHEFRLVDAMITNFHLPRTTLLLMVSALAGENLVRRAYEHAIRERYRFYSFGDAMLIV